MGNNNTSKEIIKSNKLNKIDNNNTSSKNGIDIKSSSKPLEEQTKECQKEILSDLENIKQQGDLNNIKNKNILKKIFNNLNKGKKYKIINYNKKLQKRLDINIKDYKEFVEIYSSIEIEIIPKKKLSGNLYFFNKFMKNTHIYFNDNLTEEVNKYYINEDDKIEKIKIIIDYQETSFKKLFYDCDCIESISFIKFNRNNIIDMNCMFFGCSSLKEINFYNFNTDNVTDLCYMFYECKLLNKLDLSKFNTEKVIHMRHMFDGCSSLKELKISNFNTKNVENMNSMFKACSLLNYIPINNFITSNVINMSEMFYNCKRIKDLDLSNFNTDKVRNMKSMFAGCHSKLVKKIKTSYKNFEDAAFKKEKIDYKNIRICRPPPDPSDYDDSDKFIDENEVILNF